MRARGDVNDLKQICGNGVQRCRLAKPTRWDSNLINDFEGDVIGGLCLRGLFRSLLFSLTAHLN
jgi:hypothetical protein